MIADWIAAIVSIVAAGAAICAARIAKKTLSQSQEDQRKGLDRQKKQATLDAYNKLQEQVFDHINRYKPAEIREIFENRNNEEYKILSSYLTRIEHFCVGLETNIYDYKT